MITLRPAQARGTANFGWLDSRHTFSFGNYYDPRHMGFGALRVINEDKIKPAAGFPTHGHRDMEIISYVLTGELAHKDSIGNGSVILPGDVQRMSAGRGIMHSEYNHSQQDPAHFLQIWLLPNQKGLKPSYEQKHFSPEEKRGKLRLVASPDGRDGSVTIHQDAFLYGSLLEPGEKVGHEIERGRKAWLQVARGSVQLQDQELTAGDGAAVADETELHIKTLNEGTEILLFDLAG